MTVTEGQILTVESIPKYIDDHTIDDLKGIIDSTEGLQVKAIMGGNVNYAFCLTTSNNKTVFLKQAPEFVAIFGPDGFPLTSERMQREMDVYKEWKIILSSQEGQLDKKYLPDIYNFDKSYMCVLMEFLDGHELLDHILVDKDPNLPKEVAINLGDFMGRVHAKTHSSNNVDVDQNRIDYLTKHFENREMRDIQLEFVFTKCFKEATDEQRAGLELTPEFMKEIELLKSQYDATHKPSSNNLVLTHGDFHPGSVMVNPTTGSTKVIDPEFTIYGPPGLDVGSLLSGYCLGAIHQAYSNNTEGGKRIVESMKDIWDAYLKAFKECMPESCINDELIKEIEIQTVGFTLIEVCRTALEFAGGRKWLQFDDVSTKASSKKAALRVVDKCMVGRNDGGIQLMFDEISKVVSEV